MIRNGFRREAFGLQCITGVLHPLNKCTAVFQDAKRLESGLQFQNETEVAGYLLESENLIRQQIIDIQILVDGKYYQADQLIQR